MEECGGDVDGVVAVRAVERDGPGLAVDGQRVAGANDDVELDLLPGRLVGDDRVRHGPGDGEERGRVVGARVVHLEGTAGGRPEREVECGGERHPRCGVGEPARAGHDRVVVKQPVGAGPFGGNIDAPVLVVGADGCAEPDRAAEEDERVCPGRELDHARVDGFDRTGPGFLPQVVAGHHADRGRVNNVLVRGRRRREGSLSARAGGRDLVVDANRSFTNKVQARQCPILLATVHVPLTNPRQVTQPRNADQSHVGPGTENTGRGRHIHLVLGEGHGCEYDGGQGSLQ